MGSNIQIENIDLNEFNTLTATKVIIVILIILLAVIVILRVFNIKSLRRRKGIVSEIQNINSIKNRDKTILRATKMLRLITNIVENTPFKTDKSTKEYYQYNLNRANVKAPGDMRYMTPEEFNGVIKFITAIIIALGAFILMINSTFGLLIILLSIITSYTIPMLVIRGIVSKKDKEIKENFTNLYLMIHYVLITGGNTPISRIMKSYSRTTTSDEMLRFIDTCVSLIETHGEYKATNYITKEYKEIIEVTRLMRLIRQLYDGGDIKQELIGFRDELIKSEKYNIQVKGNKLIERANLASKILFIILGQAIISAMAIYLPDLGLMTSLFGR